MQPEREGSIRVADYGSIANGARGDDVVWCDAAAALSGEVQQQGEASDGEGSDRCASVYAK